MSTFQSDEFPILCETCLGDNPYLRMTREKRGSGCKICERPFDIFRWKPGPKARFKKTEICRTCAKLKNVCQTCILDLEYGLPVQVRDEALKQNDLRNGSSSSSASSVVLANMPTQRANRDFLYEQLENNTGVGRVQGANGQLSLPYDRVRRGAGGLAGGTALDHVGQQNYGREMLMKLHRPEPYYKRNLSHICSFYVKGTCNRGDACPYRHEMPQNGELSEQNIKDRFFGHNDPVAKKMLERHDDMTGTGSGKSGGKMPETPEDLSIRTLFVGGVDHTITEDHIRDKFEPFGPIGYVNVLHNKRCAFVTFNTRSHAETAMAALWDGLFLSGRRCKLHWGRGRDDNETEANDLNEMKDDKDSKDTTKSKTKSKNKTKTKGDDEDDSDDSDDSDDMDAPPGMKKAPIYTESERKYLQEKGILPPELPALPDPSLSVANQMKFGYKNKSGGKQYRSMRTHYNEASMGDNGAQQGSDMKGKLGGQYAYPSHVMYHNLHRQDK